MVTDVRALNMLHQRQKYCRYCDRPVNRVSPMYLDCKRHGDDYIFWHTKCAQSKGDRVYEKANHKSSRSRSVKRAKVVSKRRHG